jgi:MFS transporter, FSR family, fosmidomycin resistance protein
MKKKKDEFQTGNVLTVATAHFIHDIYPSFVAPIVDELKLKFGINYTLIGLLQVINRIPALLNPFVGIFAESMKMRYLVIFTPAATAISMSLIGVASGYGILAILLFTSGVSSAFFHVPTPVMIKKVAGAKTGKGMSFYMVGGEAARSVGPLIVTAAVTHWGLSGTYKLMPLGIVASIVLFFRLKDIEIRKDLSGSKIEFKKYGSILRKYIPLLVTVAGITFFRGAMKSALTLYLPTFLRDQGNTIWQASQGLALVQFTGIVGTMFSGTLSDRFGRKNTLMLITITSPLLMMIFILFRDAMAYPILAVIGFFLVGHQSVILATIHDTDTSHLPFLNGIYMTTNLFLNAFMIMLVGWLADHIGLIKTFWISSGIAIFSVFFAMRLKVKE